MSKNKILLVVVLLLGGIFIFFGVKNTYSVGEQYMITFNRYEKNEVLQICKTGTNGKIDNSTCYGATSVGYSGICYEWQSGRTKYTNDELAKLTITSNMDLYCVQGQSYTNWSYVAKCFKCGEQYFWQIGGGGDTTPNHPEFGFPRTNVDSKTCVVVADITEKDKCKAEPPKAACYVCDGKYTWTNNPGTNCTKQENIESENYCKAPEVKEKKCYVCDGEFRWTDDPNSNCTVKEEIKDEANCKIVNPPTGSIAIFIIWIIGIFSVVYAVVYFKELKNSSE